MLKSRLQDMKPGKTSCARVLVCCVRLGLGSELGAGLKLRLAAWLSVRIQFWIWILDAVSPAFPCSSPSPPPPPGTRLLSSHPLSLFLSHGHPTLPFSFVDPKTGRMPFKGLSDCAMQIVSKEGPVALWTGFGVRNRTRNRTRTEN